MSGYDERIHSVSETEGDTAGDRLPLSLCMIVRDEAIFLQQCLQSVSTYVTEMIIVDTGSIDGTIAIAEAYGAKVIRVVWEDDFAVARNIALEHARQPWILVLDGDECLAPFSMTGWKKLLGDGQCLGYYVQLVSRVGSKENASGSITDAVCRLFRNDQRIRFKGTLHEEVASSIAAIDTAALKFAPLTINHEGYLDEIVVERDKKKRNGRILQAALLRNPSDPVLRYAMGTELFSAGELEQAVAWLEPIVEELPPDSGYASDVLLKLSHACRALGRLEAAVSWAELGLKQYRYEDFPDLHEARAAVLLEQDQADQAVEALGKALAIGASPIYYSSAAGAGGYRTMLARGFAYERLYNWQAAAADYSGVIERKPDYLPAWERLLMLGSLHDGLNNRLAEAVGHLCCCEQGTAVVRLFGREAVVERMADLGLEREADLSAQLIGGLKEQEPFWRGLLLVQQGKEQEGCRLWERMPERSARRSLYLAALALRSGDSEAAQHLLGEAAVLAPSALAQALLRVRAWPAWQALLAAPVPAAARMLAPLQWCALLGAHAPAPSGALAALLLRTAAPNAPAQLAAGALAQAAGEWPAAAERFAAARAQAARPWHSRAAAAGLAAAFAARARAASAPAHAALLAAPLQSEQELLLRISSAIYPL